MDSSRLKPERMEETLEGGRDPPWAVEPLEEEEEEEEEEFLLGTFTWFPTPIRLTLH